MFMETNMMWDEFNASMDTIVSLIPSYSRDLPETPDHSLSPISTPSFNWADNSHASYSRLKWNHASAKYIDSTCTCDTKKSVLIRDCMLSPQISMGNCSRKLVLTPKTEDALSVVTSVEIPNKCVWCANNEKLLRITVDPSLMSVDYNAVIVRTEVKRDVYDNSVESPTSDYSSQSQYLSSVSASTSPSSSNGYSGMLLFLMTHTCCKDFSHYCLAYMKILVPYDWKKLY